MPDAVGRRVPEILRRRGDPEGQPDGNSAAPAHPSGRLCARCVDVALPRALVLAAVLGGFTAVTGIYIAINCDFLSDLRFGYCRGLPFNDRNHCCGGADNIEAATGRCSQPRQSVLPGNATDSALPTGIDWVPWQEATLAPFAVYLAATIALAASAASILASFAPAAKGSGIPDVKAAVSGFANSRSFSAMCLLIKSLGLALVVGAGLSLGKEGPLIHIGVCWVYVLRESGGFVGRLAQSVPLHEVICVGAAAGVSTAFGAPVGGVLFAVEELGGVRALSQRALILAFAGSFTASFVLKSWNLYGSNQLTMFKLATATNSPAKEWRTWEIPLFLLLGVAGGLVGSFFVRLNLAVVRLRRRHAESGRSWLLPSGIHDALVRRLPSALLVQRRPSVHHGCVTDDGLPGIVPSALHVFEVVLIAGATASLNYHLTSLLKYPMGEVIHGLFESCPNALGSNLGLCDEGAVHGFAVSGALQASLVAAASLRFVQTVLTFGTMLPSGLFIPSLYIGAVLGRLIGIWTLSFNAHIGVMRSTPINPSAFAMVGAVAVLSGFARMTVSLVVIMLELTGEINYAVPFMCAVLVAKLVGDAFAVSIYDAHAALNGFAAIEEPEGLRMTAAVADIALPCACEDILDVSEPVRVESLWAALGEELADKTCDQGSGGGEPSSGRRASDPRSPSGWQRDAAARGGWRGEPLDVLVLVAGGEQQVCGVVRRERLRRWLAGQGPGTGALCRFRPPEAKGRAQRAEVAADLPREPELDAGDLVEGNLRRLLTTAPLLTAVCAFREFPELSYCVCRSELAAPGLGGLSVLSRSNLELALASGRFAAAFWNEASAMPQQQHHDGVIGALRRLAASLRRSSPGDGRTGVGSNNVGAAATGSAREMY